MRESMNRRSFIFASGAFAASVAGGVTTTAPRLKVGIVSDTHIQDEASARHFEMALRYFRDRGVECTPVFRNDEQLKPNATSLMRDGEIQLVINTPTNHSGAVRDGHRMRRLAVELEIPFLTTINGAKIAVGAIEVARKNQMGVKSMQDFHTLVR